MKIRDLFTLGAGNGRPLARSPRLRLEELEQREVPALLLPAIDETLSVSIDPADVALVNQPGTELATAVVQFDELGQIVDGQFTVLPAPAELPATVSVTTDAASDMGLLVDGPVSLEGTSDGLATLFYANAVATLPEETPSILPLPAEGVKPDTFNVVPLPASGFTPGGPTIAPLPADGFTPAGPKLVTLPAEGFTPGGPSIFPLPACGVTADPPTTLPAPAGGATPQTVKTLPGGVTLESIATQLRQLFGPNILPARASGGTLGTAEFHTLPGQTGAGTEPEALPGEVIAFSPIGQAPAAGFGLGGPTGLASLPGVELPSRPTDPAGGPPTVFGHHGPMRFLHPMHLGTAIGHSPVTIHSVPIVTPGAEGPATDASANLAAPEL